MRPDEGHWKAVTENVMHGLMRGRWKSIGCKEEARGCKLPTEADRPELLYPAPRQLVIALLSSEFLGAD